MDVLILFTTTPNISEAEDLARKMIEAKLAACVQVLPRMTSFYFWGNAVQKDTEHLVLIKTTTEKFAELENFIQVNHSYEVPEIVAVKAENVSTPYFEWLKNYLN